MNEEAIKDSIRKSYGKIAVGEGGCCTPGGRGCDTAPADTVAKAIGYTQDDLGQAPEGANLGLGCGNPVALASLKEGEIVLDLGSGAGLDCFLAAGKVGERGRIIGVDMTPEMIAKARGNAAKSTLPNVEFRLGEIEHLPVSDSSVDVVMSNCVINLVPDKGQVFREAFRVLRPGGRLAISDIVLTKELPGWIKDSVAAYVGCLAGATLKDAYLHTISNVGFESVTVTEEAHFPMELMSNDPTVQGLLAQFHVSKEEAEEIARSVLSIRVQAVKP